MLRQIFFVKILLLQSFIRHILLFSFSDMSKKFVLIPLQTFTDLCSKTKVSGTTITGVIKSGVVKSDESSKRPRKEKRFSINHYAQNQMSI